MGSVLPTVIPSSHRKMISAILIPFLLAVPSAAPGGYTGLGGLYKNMNQNADYMPAAKNAARLAVEISFENDESLTGGSQDVTSGKQSTSRISSHLSRSQQWCRPRHRLWSSHPTSMLTELLTNRLYTSRGPVM